MLKYLLPCSCGKAKLEVDSSQSGLAFPCPECGTQLTVPTMRGLRELEIAGSNSDERISTWGAREGLLIIAAVLVISGFGWCLWTDGFEIITMDPYDYSEYYPPEDISLQETWAYFYRLRDTGLSTEPDAYIQGVALKYDKAKYSAWGKIGIGALGIILAIVALAFFRPKPAT